MAKPNNVVTRWLNEIDLAKKREKDFRKEGTKILEIYGGKRIDTTPFNILYSNTETLFPAVYSLVPRPVVQRRFKDEDPMGKAAAQASTRMLEFLLDTNVDGYETFDDGIKAAALDALLPGRGVTAIKYDADIAEMLGDGETQDDPGEPPQQPDQYKKSELVCLDSKSWNRVYFGYARKWSKVPWIAYEMEIDREEAQRIGIKDSIVAKMNFQISEYDKEEDEKNSDENNKGDRKVALVYQIWDKEGGRKLRYVSPQYKDDYLKVDDDPLELTGFYNCPKPLQFLEKSNDLLPVSLYALYENQAKELNEITRRINLIVKAIKAKAIYDTELGDDIKNLVEAEDNDLVPASANSSLAAEKGLSNALWFWPIDALASVLQILVASRDQCKQVIYEITGISDILRGATQASETATAQKIKSQWGSLRLKRMQKRIQDYCRDVLRMMLEVAAAKFNEETWAKMTGLPFLLSAKYNELQSISQALQMEVQRQQMSVPPPQPGQPPMPPSPQMQQLQRVQQQLQTPQWSQVLELLQNDLQRAYRIDIETNSTVEAEATEDKEQLSEAMAAVGQALNGLTPLVVAGTLPWQAAQGMLLTIVRRFRFGTEIEDMIKAMQPPQPPEDAKKAAEAQQMQMQQKMAQSQAAMMQKEQAFAQEKQQGLALIQELKAKLGKSEIEKEMQKREADLQLREIQLKADEAQFKLEKTFADQMISTKARVENESLAGKQKIASLENSKFKTENVVNKKADDTIGKSTQALEGIVSKMADMHGQLLQVVAEQGNQHQAHIDTLSKAITAPRKKTAKRGKDGKIESVVEEVA